MIDNFASRNVILVTVGYRLGTFGFFHTPEGTWSEGLYPNAGFHG